MNLSQVLERAKALDAADPLAGFRHRFAAPDEECIYLDGNSLGKMPVRAMALTMDTLDQWATQMVGGWKNGWYEAPLRLGDKLAPLIGAQPGEVAMSDSTTVNLHKLAGAALRARPGRTRVVTDDLNFPSDVLALQSVVEGVGGELVVVRSRDGMTVPEDDLAAAVDERTALVSLSHTAFKSGFVHDLKRVTQVAHQAGALMLWDLSHSVGAVHVDLGAAGADLAVGCTYKYLSGGPGAPAFLYVRAELQASLDNPVAGWFGQAHPFAFSLEPEPAAGIRRFLVGTPPILSLLGIEAGLDIVLEAGAQALRTKSMLQTEFLIELADQFLVPIGFTVASPRDATVRGSHVSLAHPHALAIDRALIAEHQVIPDFRTPDNVRFGLAPLTTSFDEIARAVEATRSVVETRSFEAYEGAVEGVT